MAAITVSALPAGLRRLGLATLFTAAVTIGIGYPAVASAEWDIGAYDHCMATPHNDPNFHEYCCNGSGGVWTGSKCVAPADNQQGPGDTTNPLPIMPGGVMPPPMTEANLP